MWARHWFVVCGAEPAEMNGLVMGFHFGIVATNCLVTRVSVGMCGLGMWLGEFGGCLLFVFVG